MQAPLRPPRFRSPVRKHGYAPPEAINTSEAETELENFRRTQPLTSPQAIASLKVAADSLTGDTRAVRHVVVIHGDSGEVPLDDNYPSKRAGFVAVGDFVIDLHGLTELDPSGFPDPATIEHAVDAGETKTFIMPSTCVEYKPGMTFLDGWRSSLRWHLQNRKYESDSLDEILRQFIQDPVNGKILLGTCPHTGQGCAYDYKTHGDLWIQPPGEPCPQCATELYVADALRLHRELEQEASNGTVFARLREAVVHLVQWHYVRTVSAKLPAAFDDTAFILLGPHAIYGATAAGLKSRFESSYQATFAQHQRPPLLVGLYTTGAFVDYARNLDLEPGTVLELTKAHIAKHVVVGAAPNWGDNTYYGTPFIYRTRRGHTCAFTLVTRPGTGTAPKNYPEMPRALRLLDNIVDQDDPLEGTLPNLIQSKGTVDAEAAHSILQALTKK